MKFDIPKSQRAVQLIGPGSLTLNSRKEVTPPGPHQILCKVEAVGLCFSDLKLLKQFSKHPRKTGITAGIDQKILDEIPSYAPDNAPTVPGHEAVVRIWAVGDKVDNFKPGQRYLVQTDYRWLPTANSNASFGYNFEGALQEYVLMDQRIITSPKGESMLIPASESLSASAIALVEPWACVENAYSTTERATLKTGGKMLIVAESPFDINKFHDFLISNGQPGQITLVAKNPIKINLSIPVTLLSDISQITDLTFDDVIYFGSEADTIEILFDNIAPQGLLNIVLCGSSLKRNVITYVGRVHYGGIRIVGTVTADPADSLRYIPKSAEIRKGDKINVIGAAGPMGMMHVVRNICQGISNVSITACDLDENRLMGLNKIAVELAKKNNVKYQACHSDKINPEEKFDYVVLMVPAADLVAQAVQTASDNAIINIFAGIPASVTTGIDLQRYIEKQIYFIGTSGSVLQDMKVVLQKLQTEKLDTNLSIAAVADLESAVEGIDAVENRTIPGKIIVYPSCHNLPLTTIQNIPPEVAELMSDGLWNGHAENKLLELYKK